MYVCTLAMYVCVYVCMCATWTCIACLFACIYVSNVFMLCMLIYNLCNACIACGVCNACVVCVSCVALSVCIYACMRASNYVMQLLTLRASRRGRTWDLRLWFRDPRSGTLEPGLEACQRMTRGSAKYDIKCIVNHIRYNRKRPRPFEYLVFHDFESIAVATPGP